MFSVVVIGWNRMFGCGDVLSGSVLFELLRCAQCNHAFACSLAATMHTHTLLLLATVLVFHSLAALSPLSSRYTQALLLWKIVGLFYLQWDDCFVLQVLEGLPTPPYLL